MLLAINKQMKRRQRGIGLLELMLSLSIIAILLVMATRYYIASRQSNQMNNAVSMIEGVAGAEAQYNVTNSGPAVDIPTLTKNNYLPTSFAGPNGDGTGVNPWGGNLTVAPGTPTTAGGFTVTMTGISPFACINMPLLLDNNTTQNSASCPTNGSTLTVYFY